MKRIFLALLILTLALSLAGCKDEKIECTDSTLPEGKYGLSVNDPYGHIAEPLEASYKEGDEIIVKTHIVCDATVIVELNGARPEHTELVKDENGSYLYNLHRFTMPKKDSLLRVYTGGGMMDLSYNVTVNDPYGVIVNNVAGKYEPGDTVYINTYAQSIDKSRISFSANKLFVEYVGEIKNDTGDVLYYQWKLTMPYEDVTISVALSEITNQLIAIDTDGLLYKGVSNYYKIGEDVSVFLTTNEVKLYFNDLELDLSLEEIKDEHGAVVCYKQVIKMPERVSTLRIEEFPAKSNIAFTEKTGDSDLFDVDYSGIYLVGQEIKITASRSLPNKEILIKANGKRIEPASLNEWRFVVPQEDVELTAYVINTPLDEDWVYLNVIDEHGLLDKLYDGYYKRGEELTVDLPWGVSLAIVDNPDDAGKMELEILYSPFDLDYNMNLKVIFRLPGF